MSLLRLPDDGSLVRPRIIDFAVHQNFGIAFDLPFAYEIVFLLSLIIGYKLLELAFKHLHSRPLISFSCFMIMIGALGNAFDRFVYGFTVDYIILFGRSAINLSDLVIVVGVFFLLISSREQKQTNSI